MGNKIVGGSQSLRQPPTTRRSALQNPNNATRGSTESLCTFISLNSHADQCLLKERLSHSMDDSTTLMTSEFDSTLNLMDETSTLLTTLDEDQCSTGEEIAGDKLRIPEKLLQKLTTEDWNDLVHFICSSMEQSLQSNILKTLEEIRETNSNSCGSNSSSNSDILNNVTETRREKQTPSPNNDTNTSNNNSIPSGAQRRSRRTPRPVSMPPGSFPESGIKYSQKLNNHHSNRSYHQRTNSKSPPALFGLERDSSFPVDNTISRTRASSSPHRVHFGDSQLIPLRRTCSGSSLDELEIKSKCRSLEGKRGYLTLDQLKDLGLSLQQEPSTRTSERLSSFSMKCWHGDPNNNDVLRRRPKRRQRRRSMTRKKNEQVLSAQKQKPQFEQLCLLGPKTIPSSSPPPSSDNSQAKDDVVPTTMVDDDDDHLSNSDDSNPDVKVEHLHQHSHHHYHHFIHHSLSQPSDLCGKSYSQPIHYIVSKS